MGNNPTPPAPAAGRVVLRTPEPPALSPAASPLCRGDITKLCQAARSPLPLPAEPQTQTPSINDGNTGERGLHGAGRVSHRCPGTRALGQGCCHGALPLLPTRSRRVRPGCSSPGLHRCVTGRGLTRSAVASAERRPCERGAGGHGGCRGLSDIDGREGTSPSARRRKCKTNNAVKHQEQVRFASQALAIFTMAMRGKEKKEYF